MSAIVFDIAHTFIFTNMCVSKKITSIKDIIVSNMKFGVFVYGGNPVVFLCFMIAFGQLNRFVIPIIFRIIFDILIYIIPSIIVYIIHFIKSK